LLFRKSQLDGVYKNRKEEKLNNNNKRKQLLLKKRKKIKVKMIKGQKLHQYRISH